MNPAQRSLNRWWAIAFGGIFGWGFCLWSIPVIALLRFWHFEIRPTPDGDTDRREPVLTR